VAAPGLRHTARAPREDSWGALAVCVRTPLPRAPKHEKDPPAGRSGPSGGALRSTAVEVPCSNPCRSAPCGTLLHRNPGFRASTPWGLLRCPEAVHRPGRQGMILPGHPPVYLCATAVHSLWTAGQPPGPRPVVHRQPTGEGLLPTDGPQLCPLFGNGTRPLTVSSERRHIKSTDSGVGNVGKPGDAAGEKWPPPVHRVCVTSGCPQRGGLVHGRHPQAQWTKKRL
jgi:hypothetical protein